MRAEMIAVRALAVGDESIVWKKFFFESAPPVGLDDGDDGVLAVTKAVPVVSYTVTTGTPFGFVMTGFATIDVTATRVLLLVVELARELVATGELEWPVLSDDCNDDDEEEEEREREEAELATLAVLLCAGGEADDSSAFGSVFDELEAAELVGRASSMAELDDLVTTALTPPEDIEKSGISADALELELCVRDAGTAGPLTELPASSWSTEAPAVAENEMECLVADDEAVLGLTSLIFVRCWLNVLSVSEVPGVVSAWTAETTALTWAASSVRVRSMPWYGAASDGEVLDEARLLVLRASSERERRRACCVIVNCRRRVSRWK